MRASVRSVRGQRAAHNGPGRLVTRQPLTPRRFTWRRRDLTGSLGTPCARAPLIDPGETSTPSPLRRFGAADRCLDSGGPRKMFFEAQSRGSRTRCLRFAAPVARTPRKTRFRLVANLCRVGVATHRVPIRGFRSSRHSILLVTAYLSHPGTTFRTSGLRTVSAVLNGIPRCHQGDPRPGTVGPVRNVEPGCDR